MNGAPAAGVIDRIASAHRAAHARLRGGPRWTERRDRAIARLVERGLPDRRDENWKYLDWPELDRRGFDLAAGADVPEGLEAGLLPLTGALRVVLVDGRHVPALSGGVLPAGVSIESLAEVAGRDPDGVAGLLRVPGDDVDDRLALLAEAFADDGVLVRIQPGANVEPVIYLVHATGGAAAASHARVVVEAGAGCRVRLVEHFVSPGGADSLGNLVSEIRVADGARLEHIRLHEQGPGAVQFETILATQARDSHYLHQCFMLGGRIVRTNLTVRLEGPGAANEVQGLMMIDGQRQADVYTLFHHLAPHTRSDELFRGVATDRGRGAFNGKIVVHEGAVKADSRQSSRNLILSPLAEINARPQLEILTDDVKCSHGATTGSLDANQLFYLLSRGIDMATARGLLTFAFCEDVIARVPEPAIRAHLERIVVGRLPDRDIIREFV